LLDFGILDSQKQAIDAAVHFNDPYEYPEEKGIALGGLMAEKLPLLIPGFSCITTSQDETGFHYFHLTKLTKSIASQQVIYKAGD
jgi:hypothetical protein